MFEVIITWDPRSAFNHQGLLSVPVEGQVEPTKYSFATEAEARAFKMGLREWPSNLELTQDIGRIVMSIKDGDWTSPQKTKESR